MAVTAAATFGLFNFRLQCRSRLLRRRADRLDSENKKKLERNEKDQSEHRKGPENPFGPGHAVFVGDGSHARRLSESV